MAISPAITEFEGAMDALRAKFAEINLKISDAEMELRTLEIAQPHTDDIVAVFMSSLPKVEKDFKRQFAAHLHAKFVRTNLSMDPAAPAKAVKGQPQNILRMGAPEADGGAGVILSKNGAVDLNTTVAAYFLRRLFADELPALIDELCPVARSGMKTVDRDRSISEVKAKLAKLLREKEEVEANLIAARKVVLR